MCEENDVSADIYRNSIKTDVLIVGSGFSGAFAASRLIDTGVDVMLVERGPWRKTVPVESMGITKAESLPAGSRMLTHLTRTLHHKYLPKKGINLNKKGVLEVGSYKGSNTLCSSGVGGGSHVYGGLLERSPNSQYWDGMSSELSEEGMQRFCNSVIERLKPSQLGSGLGIPNFPPSSLQKDSIFEAVDEEQPAMGILFKTEEGTEKSNNYDVKRFPSDFTGDSIFGSHKGSKTTLDFSVIGPAMEKGLRTLSMCEVTAVYSINNGYLVHIKNHCTGNCLIVRATRVVLAAGTMNTVKLLFENSPRLNPMPGLGLGFGTNGDYAGYWRCQDVGKDYSLGTPCHGRVRLKEEEDCPDLIFANIGAPILDGKLVPKFITNLMNSTKRDLMVVGMGADEETGTFIYENGRLNVEYDSEKNPIFQKIRNTFNKIGDESKKRVYFGYKPATVHQFGGARISDSSEEGVISGTGEVHNNKNLFVVDASALPKAVGGPPSVTVATWSSYVAENIANEIEKEDAKKYSYQAYDSKSDIKLHPKNIVGMKINNLDELFSLLPIPKNVELKGAFWGSLVMTLGVSQLPAAIRRFLIRFLEILLFKSWKGKFFDGDKGHNLFGSKDNPKSSLPFSLGVCQSRDGTGRVIQLDYDIDKNEHRQRKILGEARKVNDGLYLARMYYGKKRVLYYLLTKNY